MNKIDYIIGIIVGAILMFLILMTITINEELAIKKENKLYETQIENLQRSLCEVEEERDSYIKKYETTSDIIGRFAITANAKHRIITTDYDFNLLCRIVEAEAGNQSKEGRIAVANVIINRIISPSFPDDIVHVIYEERAGTYQFSPVFDNRINEVEISNETREAVLLALAGESVLSGDVVFFATINNDFSSFAEKDVVIGDHQFWKEK